MLEWVIKKELPLFFVRYSFVKWIFLDFPEVSADVSDLLRSSMTNFEPLHFLISRLRLKQFPKLFYSQKFRVLEILVFLELFSQRKVSLSARFAR